MLFMLTCVPDDAGWCACFKMCCAASMEAFTACLLELCRTLCSPSLRVYGAFSTVYKRTLRFCGS